MRLIYFLLLLPVFGQAQNLINGHPFPQQQVNEALQKAWEEKNIVPSGTDANNGTSGSLHSGIYHLLQGQSVGSRALQLDTLRSGGILYVGNTPHDTLVVTGAWQYNGYVAVVNDGVLIFSNAQATISGSLIVVGNGQVLASNSSFLFPQQYFYEWGLEGDGHGLLQMRHCTLDFNGLATPWSFADSCTIILQNVHFTSSASTIGLNAHCSFIVDTANLLGEIVATDTILLSLKNVDTVIVWHKIQRGAGLTWTFPNGYLLPHYAIGPDSTGVSGLQYTIELDNIKQVHWALMPENLTNVNVSNSTIRSVAVIYRGTATGIAQGLVDNSSYVTSPTFFTDRTFQLTNCSVKTWAVYPTDTTYVDITSCILGEIGTGGHGHTSCSSMFCDGTGGYFWTNGFGFQSASGCSFSCAVRAEQGSTMVVGFGSIAASTGLAIDSGLLFLIQTPTISPPVAYDGSDIWVGMLTPGSVDSGYVQALTGSAYILRGPTSHLMSFASYYIQYQLQGDTTWTMIDSVHTTPVTQSQGTVANWNTTGVATGHYNMRMIIKDNYGDSVTVPSGLDVVIGTPVTTGIANIGNNDLKVFPNPAHDQLTITSDQMPINNVRLINMLGQEEMGYNCTGIGTKTSLTIDISNVPAGIYIYRITSENDEVHEGKVVKM